MKGNFLERDKNTPRSEIAVAKKTIARKCYHSIVAARYLYIVATSANHLP